MKKILSAFLILIMISVSLSSVSFAVGEVAGKVYGTDIVTYMNNSPITSYNIGGETCIDAEILNWYYGFDVYWYEDTRRLEITDKGGNFSSGQAASGELVDKNSAKVGDVIGYYYNTDIVTTLNGKEIESYNIGGRTVILAEAMVDFGYSVVWDENQRTLSITKPMDFYKYDTPYGTVKSVYNYNQQVPYAVLCEAKVLLIKDKNNYSPVVTDKTVRAYTNAGGISVINIKDFVDLFDGKLDMYEGTVTHQSEDGSGNITMYDAYTYRLEFFYDNNIHPRLISKTDSSMVPEGDWPGTKSTDNVSNLLNISEMIVNGVAKPIRTQYGGKVVGGNIILLNGEMYIPVQMVAELMGYDLAALDIVSYSVDK